MAGGDRAQGLASCWAPGTRGLHSLNPTGWCGVPRTALPCCRALEGAGSQAAVLCSANSWLLSNEVEREETRQEALPTHSAPLPASGLSGQHPAETGPTVHILALPPSRGGKARPEACAGSDQSELAWLLPSPPDCSPRCHPGKQGLPFVPLQCQFSYRGPPGCGPCDSGVS